MWFVDGRVATKSHGGKLAAVYTTNPIENEQGWKSIQFVSTAAVLIIIILVNYYSLGKGRSFVVTFSCGCRGG